MRELEFCRISPGLTIGIRNFTLLESTSRACSSSAPFMDERKSSPHRDFGTQSRAVLRVAGRKTGQNRWVKAIYNAGSVTSRNIGRVLHVLWLEVTGLLFLMLALVGGGAAVREHHLRAIGSGSTAKMMLAAFFSATFAYFGVNSFWRSRRRK
jgi:hypothetical protein